MIQCPIDVIPKGYNETTQSSFVSYWVPLNTFFGEPFELRADSCWLERTYQTLGTYKIVFETGCGNKDYS